MERKKRNIVEWAMHYRQIVIMMTCVLLAFGVWGLYDINKNEFPDITIRQGVVVAAYPGASSEDVEQQVTKPLEKYIFTYKEVKKEKTKSYSQNGLCIIQIELNDDIDDKEAFWSKFKHGMETFKATLPAGVLAVQVNDDFGDSSAMLITMESKDKTYRELQDYMDDLQEQLQTIESVGRITVFGQQQEQISIVLDYNRLAHYGISDKMIVTALKMRDIVTTGGVLKDGHYDSPIMLKRALNLVDDVEQTIVYSDPRGVVVRLKDVADVRREYAAPTSYVTNNGVKCIILSVEMKKDRSITDLGADIYEKLDAFEASLPEDVHLFRITDQAQVVGASVVNFLKELLIAVVAVVIVVILLMPLRVALVAASTIPITIFISLGLFYAFGIELNTVTLAALIVTLGMIVDNSIVIIDSYVEKLGEGMSRWHASIESTTHFFKSILTATLAISITFFPFLLTTSGSAYDLLLYFPWAITLILLISLLVAMLIVPFLQFWFIRKPMNTGNSGKQKFNILDWMQRGYDWLIECCFRHPYAVVGGAVVFLVIGILLLANLPQKLFPTAERNQLAVEISTPIGTPLEKTAALADSLEHLMGKDDRVVSIASFKGTSSPRFHTAYAPQFGGSHFAQFVVNTTSPKATEQLVAEWRERYAEAFPGAYIRIKQLSYSLEAAPIEIRLSGNDWQAVRGTADSITALMRKNPELSLVRNDLLEPLVTTQIALDPQRAGRQGVTNLGTELTMLLRYNASGLPVGTIWQDDYPVSICLKGSHADASSRQQMQDEMIPVVGGLRAAPLRQMATVSPRWDVGQIPHRNGVRTVTISSEVVPGANVTGLTKQLQQELKEFPLPDGVNLEWGGEIAENETYLPMLIKALTISVVIIFFLLLSHFKRISTAVLLIFSLSLCTLGAAVGMMMLGEITLTCLLGIISLMGILVRNAIIMYDYAEELRSEQNLTAHEAIYLSAKRRMRPIFLTSAAASMGVIPMILGGSSLWAPMGNVIFYGTLITMLFILTVLPIAYWLVMSGSTKKRLIQQMSENQ